VENVETKQGEAFKALLHETESIRAELEGFSTLRQEHAAASKNLDAADEKIRSLERTIELLETGRADASTERTETILSRIKNLKDAAKTISEESSEVRNFASSQFSENLKGLQDLGTAFDTLKKSFDLEVSNVIKLLLFVSDKRSSSVCPCHICQAGLKFASKVSNLLVAPKGRIVFTTLYFLHYA
jgi:chromosome segregation ATPase